jgi:hypothetical protein
MVFEPRVFNRSTMSNTELQLAIGCDEFMRHVEEWMARYDECWDEAAIQVYSAAARGRFVDRPILFHVDSALRRAWCLSARA